MKKQLMIAITFENGDVQQLPVGSPDLILGLVQALPSGKVDSLRIFMVDLEEQH